MVIRKIGPAKYRLYPRRRNLHTGRRRNLGTFRTCEAAQRHERRIQYFNRR